MANGLARALVLGGDDALLMGEGPQSTDAARRPVVEYPTDWTYKVIASTQGDIEQAIRLAVGTRRHEVRPSRSSASGRYVSMTLDVSIEDEASRIAVFEALKGHSGVVLVL